MMGPEVPIHDLFAGFIMSYQTRATRLTVNKAGEPIYSEHATHIEIVDESGGEFLILSQCNGHGQDGQRIAIDPGEEWEAIKAAVDYLSTANAEVSRGDGSASPTTQKS